MSLARVVVAGAVGGALSIVTSRLLPRTESWLTRRAFRARFRALRVSTALSHFHAGVIGQSARTAEVEQKFVCLSIRRGEMCNLRVGYSPPIPVNLQSMRAAGHSASFT